MKQIRGEITKDTLEGPIVEANTEEMVWELLRCFKVSRVEIKTKVLNLNNLAIEKRMFHWLLLKSIKPKVHYQKIVMKGETMVIYEVLIKKNPIDFVWLVV